MQIEQSITGTVERVTFYNPENGWSVLKVKVGTDISEAVPVLVHQSEVFAGVTMRFTGLWKRHPKFGKQFQASSATEIMPATAHGLEKYLGSGLIKGVGPKTANKIVSHFKNRTLEVFENRIGDLVNVPGISKKKLEGIRDAWSEHKSIRDVMMFLQGHGVSTTFAVKVFKLYGKDSIKVVRDNPYRLEQDIFGIGFFSADRIALSMGIEKTGSIRMQASIRYVLNNSREEGHCYLFTEQIVERVLNLIGEAKPADIEQNLTVLQSRGEVEARMIDDCQCYYAKKTYLDEQMVAEKVRALSQVQVEVDGQRLKHWVGKYCRRYNITLSEEQRQSVLGVATKSFSILTGGPGCGKTTTTKVIFALFRAMHKKVFLTAPTGRAAQRMSEVVGSEAKTIHRLLSPISSISRFKYNRDNPLECDVLIVDECSMIDMSLAAYLLEAVPPGCQVLFIGDRDQLPAIGAGNVLGDLIDSNQVACFRLTQVFRQAKESKIIQVAHAINQGISPQIPSPIEDKSFWSEKMDCGFMESEEPSVEQLEFIKKAQKLIQRTLTERRPTLLFAEERALGVLKAEGEELIVERGCQSSLNSAGVERFDTTSKFAKVDFNELSRAKTIPQQLLAVLGGGTKNSTLHFGMTALDTIKRLYERTIPANYGKDVEIQILSPQVRGSLGTANLNRTIQELINPEAPGKSQVRHGDRVFRVGDRIIQTKNNYDLDVFNGDIGMIQDIDLENKKIRVEFRSYKPTKEVSYGLDDLIEISLSYAITIHKSQGSEFSVVIIPIVNQHFTMLQRNLVYTGLTRAKRLAVFVGAKNALRRSVRNNESRKRQSALANLV